MPSRHGGRCTGRVAGPAGRGLGLFYQLLAYMQRLGSLPTLGCASVSQAAVKPHLAGLPDVPMGPPARANETPQQRAARLAAVAQAAVMAAQAAAAEAAKASNVAGRAVVSYDDV